MMCSGSAVAYLRHWYVTFLETVENVDNAHFEQTVIRSGFEHNLYEYDARGVLVSPRDTLKNR